MVPVKFISELENIPGFTIFIVPLILTNCFSVTTITPIKAGSKDLQLLKSMIIILQPSSKSVLRCFLNLKASLIVACERFIFSIIKPLQFVFEILPSYFYISEVE